MKRLAWSVALYEAETWR